MIQKPRFNNSELYCIETAVKEDLRKFNNMTYSFLEKDAENGIRKEMNNILEKIENWKIEECEFSKALKELKPIN